MNASQTTIPQVQTHSGPGALMFVPLHSALGIGLADAIRIAGSEQTFEDAIEEAVRRYIAYLTGEDQSGYKGTNDELKPSSSKNCAWGYKDILIPLDGAELRMFFKGKYEHFKALNGKFRYNDKDYDEAVDVVKAIAGTNRNAWRDVWIKREGDSDYIRADDLRKNPAYKQPEVIAKKPPLLFSSAIEAIADLRKLGFPENERNLFFPLHHMNMDGSGRYKITMKEFERYSGEHKRCGFDSSNGKVIRRLHWLVENYTGEKTEAEWKSLIQKAVEALPIDAKE